MAVPFGEDNNPGDGISTNVYCKLNSSFLNCGPPFINIQNTGNKICNGSLPSSKRKLETGQRIKVRKGIFTSLRTITSEDIQTVAEAVEEDWKKLLKKLPGVTSNNLCFHQAFIDAMDRKDSTNMAEITLFTWKYVLPELSTIGNLSETLFSIGYPDIVTHLKP